MCDMGFLLSENTKTIGEEKFHRLIKQTDRFMIVITFSIRRRLFEELNTLGEKHEEDLKQIEGESFGSFLKKHGLVPPNLMGPEHEEKQIHKDYIKAVEMPGDEQLDNERDGCRFEVAVINKDNQALVSECVVK